MSIAATLKRSLAEVGQAVRRPEDLAKRWRQRTAESGPPAAVIAVLLANAALGLGVYGLSMKMHEGPESMLFGAFYTPLAAGLAWCIAFPALYIIKRLLGSELDFSTTLFAATVTVSFGASAMLASVPVNWFFSLTLPWAATRLVVNLVVFAGVGFCMSDVFLRVMRHLEPDTGHKFAFLWLGLLSIIGAELFVLFGVFAF